MLHIRFRYPGVYMSRAEGLGAEHLCLFIKCLKCLQRLIVIVNTNWDWKLFILNIGHNWIHPQFFVGLCFAQSLVFCVALSWSLFAFFWPLCYLSFIDLLFLVTSLVSSKIPCTLYKHAINVLAYQIGNQKPKM